MPKISIVGYPRVGADRELKKWTESYFKGGISKKELLQNSKDLRAAHWRMQSQAGADFVPSGDFSFYDLMLDTAVMLNIIPRKYRELGLCELDTTFAMAKGYQGSGGDVVALPMKKWFNTNYHYIVPEYDGSGKIALVGDKPFVHFEEARAQGIDAKPVIIGPFTFLKHLYISMPNADTDAVNDAVAKAYAGYAAKLADMGAKLLQFDEPSLVRDLTAEDVALFERLYGVVLGQKGNAHILLQTYFGDIRDAYPQAMALDFDAYGLDFIEGTQTLDLIQKHGFKQGAVLFAGVVNGKNIWRNDYAKTLSVWENVRAMLPNEVVISGSCSFLHSPYSLRSEKKLADSIKQQLAFTEEKLVELNELKQILSSETPRQHALYSANTELKARRQNEGGNAAVKARVAALEQDDFVRLPEFSKRIEAQHNMLGLPKLPTTTIGSFPQTAEVKRVRNLYKKGQLSASEYKSSMKEFIAYAVKVQEELDIDVLVHGEFERNDMVEYFGENLDGFIFTQNGWVQSYGTRCVKPPIIWDDVCRKSAITVEYSVYAQSLTKRPMKGMLTGPVTILNWSFPREDIALSDMCYQVALAIRDEVLELEQNGIKIIQVDEAALREKLPLRRSEWHSCYLDWAIKAFRLVHSGVAAHTQIHTHMCYSEFDDIIEEIDDMDADVISFEASRSSLGILSVLQQSGFKTEVGPGVYDIHSPRVPSVEEIQVAIEEFVKVLGYKKVWINPDCGLKTRGWEETLKSLQNMVTAVKQVRQTL